ncbi:MAG: hypothetical protein K6F50_06275 [Kiritimatiellae bacterium]|nr:hypothetical protein [Kiritimatiellia bacterium]
MTKKEKLMRCREAYGKRGAKLIEITHLDGRKSGIANPKAIEAAMGAIKAELERQIAECESEEADAKKGIAETVRDWMLREHPEEASMMDGFSATVSFGELASRMMNGEDFYKVLDCTESVQREHCFGRLERITKIPYGLWYDLWLASGEGHEERRKAVLAEIGKAVKEAGGAKAQAQTKGTER